MIDDYSNTSENAKVLLNLLDKYEILQKKFEKQSRLLIEIEKIINSKKSYVSKVIAIYEKIKRKRI